MSDFVAWWELPGAAGENRTKEQYEVKVREAKEPNPAQPISGRLDAVLADILAMLNAPDVYTREYIAQVLTVVLEAIRRT